MEYVDTILVEIRWSETRKQASLSHPTKRLLEQYLDVVNVVIAVTVSHKQHEVIIARGSVSGGCSQNDLIKDQV